MVEGPGIEVEFKGGRVVVHSGTVENLSPTAKLATSCAPAALSIGQIAPEGHEHAGWIYGGVSKTTSKPFYIALEDSGVMRWQAAMDFAALENARVPSREELNQMYEARNQGALKDTFIITGSTPAGWYWSSLPSSKSKAWALRFSDVSQLNLTKYYVSSLRCVRG